MSSDLPSTPDESKPTKHPALFSLAGKAVRSRIVGGLMFVLPLVITFYILKWLYEMLIDLVIEPVMDLMKWAIGQASGENTIKLPTPEEWIIPVTAVAIIIVLLYLLGMFFQSRLHKTLDVILLRVPIVTQIYKMVRNVVISIRQQQTDTKRFKRVVLVQFPHPGMRVPAFVTSSCIDENTGQTILCVYVPTTPVPTSGYMLMVPEEEVTELGWDLDETLQAIISGGITVPKTVQYFPAVE
ncbi:MAG: DUF502 domain-containing protein [Planctomycetes bacterium]|nr:DUF502 domain-containing protein [Planctomycetota bacterium]